MLKSTETMYFRALRRYWRTNRLGDSFLGLGGAPANNIRHYRDREHFANWIMRNQAEAGMPRERQLLTRKQIVERIDDALRRRGYSQCEFFNTLLAICILESSLSNPGYGRDWNGTSNACGPMQTKWSAVMDAGYRYENYLDIVFDEHPLLGVDAGVGYFLRMFARVKEEELERRLRTAVCWYNMPGTDEDSNPKYWAAYERACNSALFAEFCR